MTYARGVTKLGGSRRHGRAVDTKGKSREGNDSSRVFQMVGKTTERIVRRVMSVRARGITEKRFETPMERIRACALSSRAEDRARDQTSVPKKEAAALQGSLGNDILQISRST